jgi:uncharacterized protein YndB with AHSA1/START domain
MKILIILIVVIVTAIVAVLIAALFSKKAYNIKKEIIINKPVQDVFDYLKIITNQEKFSKWVMSDPTMKKEFRGTDGTVGFVYAWDSNKKAGAGEQEIKGIENGKRLDLEVRFIRPFVAVAKTPFTTEAITPNQTKVSWSMISEMKYPMNAILLFTSAEKLLGPDMEQSLNNLKVILEKQ